MPSILIGKAPLNEGDEPVAMQEKYQGIEARGKYSESLCKGGAWYFLKKNKHVKAQRKCQFSDQKQCRIGFIYSTH
ncbi:hypothetical protein CHI06_01010 [Bacillus sp. 7884-1]|nr:hypothetical protein CHI06_01010 [Bacillus sp. 7884-1]